MQPRAPVARPEIAQTLESDLLFLSRRYLESFSQSPVRASCSDDGHEIIIDYFCQVGFCLVFDDVCLSQEQS